MTNPSQLTIRTKWVSNFFAASNWNLNAILVFFGLRPKRKFWGIVYDSLTKQPLDPAVVKLVYLGGGEQTSITDLKGRYGFLARPGEFKILARKSNYKFPSELVKGKKDGIYDNLYHGEAMVLSEEMEVVAPNIPMDPLKSDWNQQAKTKIVNYSPYASRLGKAVVELLFWSGFVLTTILGAKYFPKIEPLVAAPFFCYIFLFLFALVLPEPKLWGRLENRLAQTASSWRCHLTLINEKFPGIEFGNVDVATDGKFLMLAKPGSYILNVELFDKQGYLTTSGLTKVRVPHRGILNKKFVVNL